MRDYDIPNYTDEVFSNPSLISTCCGKPPVGGVYESSCGELIGICSDCHENTIFEQDIEDER